jgi:DNA polymerase IIIc chi subunit
VQQEDRVKELTEFEQDLWEDKAEKFLAHNPDSVERPCLIALLDAIFTIRARDAEIESLKNK